MLKTKNKSQKGFTLIELLVVIAIVGLLATLALVALQNARQKSRDARRKGDIKQVYTALNLYITDEAVSDGEYPDTGGDGNFYCMDNAGSGLSQALITDTALLSGIPQDPLSDQRTTVSDGCYAYAGSNQDFKIMVLLESDDATMENDGGGIDTRYEVFTSGAQAWSP